MFQLPPLPFLYNALEPFVDEETMHIHHDGHHATYVKNLNEALEGHNDFLNMDLEELLKSLDKVPEQIRTKVKNNAGGHYHHSIFWTILAPTGKQPSGQIWDAINKNFGSFDAFKEKFNASASDVFGSGWAWLIVDQGKLEIIKTSNQDSPLSIGKQPILTLDLWEHAYYLKYKNKRAEWINAFWNIINWDEVQKYYLSHSI